MQAKIDEVKEKYVSSQWNECIKLALELSNHLRCKEKAGMLEWAAWASAVNGDESLRRRLHKEAATIWERMAVDSQDIVEKATYYSKASWDYNYHQYEHGSLVDLTVDLQAKINCRNLAAKYWLEAQEQSSDSEEKARYCGRAATHHFLLLDETNGDRCVDLARKVWADLPPRLGDITISSIRSLSEEFIDDIVTLEDGVRESMRFLSRTFEEQVGMTENYRRWIESWVIRYNPKRLQICFIEGMRSPVANSWIEHRSEKDVEIHSLWVRKAFRRKGVATKFMNELFGKLRDDGYEQVLLDVSKDNFAAMRLYQKLGFAVEREDEQFYSMRLNL